MNQYYNNNMTIPQTDSDVAIMPDKQEIQPVEQLDLDEVIENEKKDILDKYLSMYNIAEEIDGDTLLKIGQRVIKDFDIDEESRAEWLKEYKTAIELTKLTHEIKVTPFENASNVKFPLITQSAIQFNSRAYADIIKDDSVVKGKVIGPDPDGKKAGRAQRIGEHMSYQLLEESDGEWEEDMDSLLMCLPVVGCVFKKTYRNDTEKKNESRYVSAEDLIVNYYTKSIKTARRLTHRYELTENEIIEYIRAGLFLGFEHGEGDSEKDKETNEEDVRHVFLEQHRWWDLDEDGYQEPYIITVHKNTEKVVRIVARWDADGIIQNDETGEIIKIKPVSYFTKFPFLKSVDGGFYEMGFGILLGHTNEVINTAINQLFDAGKDEICGGGFVTKSLTTGNTGGVIKFERGEYKIVNERDDINKHIYDRRTAKPSAIIFKLLGFMTEYSERLSGNIELLSGEQKMANVPATTTVALIEQGLKVYSGIYKRIFKSLKDEFRKWQRLNRLYLDDEAYYKVNDKPGVIARADYEDKDCDVIPVADPKTVTDVQKMAKAGQVYELIGKGLNDREILRFYLESLGIPDFEKFLPPETGEKEPDIEVMKLELEREKIEMEKQTLPYDIAYIEAKTIKLIADAEAKELGKQLDQYKAEAESLRTTVGTLTDITNKQGAILDNKINSETTQANTENVNIG